MDKLDPRTAGRSRDLTADNIAELRALFPEVFTEGRIDFDALRQVLGDHVEERAERYGLNWTGKAAARQLAQQPSAGTLRPARDESVNWDTTQNLFIEGDNLEVLKLLQKSYHRKVKMIYIDPPYNTGNEFIYPDRFQDNLDTYLRYTGQVDGEGLKLTANAETGGRYHTNWLNMMYPRLKLARNLLRDDGVLVVHVDENEEYRLGLLLDELMGEENRLGTCVWDKRNPKGDARGIAYQHESIVIYARNLSALVAYGPILRSKANASRMLAEAKKAVSTSPSIEAARDVFARWVRSREELSGGEAMYNRLDDHGRVYRLVSMAWPNKQRAPEAYFVPLIHPKTGLPCPVPERGWRNPPPTMQRLLADGLIEFGADHTVQPQRRYYLEDNMSESVPSLLPFAGSDDALLNRLGIPFDHPKPVAFAQDLIAWFCPPDSIMIDFFAGSGTSGHATWMANSKDAGGRRFVLVQLPEPINVPAFETIADVSKSRLRRASEELLANIGPTGDEFDVGFRVFKLASTNIKPWDGTLDNVKASLLDAIDNIKPDRTDDDVLFELLLKYGLDLATPIATRTIEGAKVFVIGAGALVVCLAKRIDLRVVDGIVSLKGELQPEIMRVVFQDASFADDVVKTNAVQLLRRAGIDDVKSL